jgi:VWFA-related protein
MRCRFRVFVFSWLLALGPTPFSPAHAQDQPRFRSGVEVTTVDVTVVDVRGRPIADLTSADFVVRVDGVPREVVSAEWVPRTLAGENRPAPAPAPQAYSSNEAAAGGRLITMVIDQPNIRPGGMIPHRAAINGFIDRLHPSDRVSIINLGAGGTSVSFTSDREQAKRVVSTSIGGVAYPPSDKTPGDQTLDALRVLLNALRPLDVPKTVVLVSQGLAFSDYARPSFAELERTAAAARTTIHVLRLDERASDITRKEPAADSFPSPASPSPGAGRSRELPDTPLPAGPAGDRGAAGLEAAGELAAVAASSGGAMFSVVMGAESALARIESELSGSYLVALETRPGDRTGSPQALAVEVRRPGVTVRAGRYLPEVRDGGPATGAERVAAALASPIVLSGLRLRIATSSSRDTDPSKVRLLIRAEIGTDYTSPQPVTLGFVIADRDGAPVHARAGDARLQPVRPGPGSPLQYSGTAVVPPGEYTLRLAVAEGDRIGSVEHPIRAVLIP